MALNIKNEKLYVSNVEKKNSNGKEFVIANGSFMSSHKNQKGEWVNDDPFFIDVLSFSKDVISLLEDNNKKFLLVDGKISTRTIEKDGKTFSYNQLLVFSAEKVENAEKQEKEEAPF